MLSLSKLLIKTIDEKGIKVQAKEILDIDGIGEAKATTIAAAFEFVRRRIKPEGLKIKFPVDVLPLIQHYGDRKQEHFLCISINGANEVMNIRIVIIGLINQSQVHPREVFADVIAERASAVIVAHNHTDGDLKPSNEDIAVTKRMKEAAALLGISLLDHIIFNHKGFYSFVENNELQKQMNSRIGRCSSDDGCMKKIKWRSCNGYVDAPCDINLSGKPLIGFALGARWVWKGFTYDFSGGWPIEAHPCFKTENCTGAFQLTFQF